MVETLVVELDVEHCSIDYEDENYFHIRRIDVLDQYRWRESDIANVPE
jgi:hypothetical protein